MRQLFLVLAVLLLMVAANAQPRRFDFGGARCEAGYVAVGADKFAAERGCGWLQTDELTVRERSGPDALRRDFVFGKTEQTFRIADLQPGTYLLRIIVGDSEFGDHATQIRIAGQAIDFPTLSPAQSEFATLTTGVN